MDSEPSFIPKVQFTGRYQAPSELFTDEFLCRTLMIPADSDGAVYGAVVDALNRLLDPLIWEEPNGSVSRFDLAAKISTMLLLFTDSDCGEPTNMPVPFFIAAHKENQNVSGGTTSSNTYNKHALNEEIADANNLITLNGGDVTIEPGTYLLYALAYVYKGSTCHAAIFDVTGNARVATGLGDYTDPASSHGHPLSVVYPVVIAAARTYRVEVFTATAQSGNGMGVGQNIPIERFAYLIGLKMA